MKLVPLQCAWTARTTQTTDHPEAAWLYIQWANSRQANLMLSTRQWQGAVPRSGYARFEYIADQVESGNVPPIPGEGYIRATRQALDNVPGGDPSTPEEYPPVPADTPQNMDIMREADRAMSTVVSGQQTARGALDESASGIERGGISRQFPTGTSRMADSDSPNPTLTAHPSGVPLDPVAGLAVASASD